MKLRLEEDVEAVAEEDVLVLTIVLTTRWVVDEVEEWEEEDTEEEGDTEVVSGKSVLFINLFLVSYPSARRGGVLS